MDATLLDKLLLSLALPMPPPPSQTDRRLRGLADKMHAIRAQLRSSPLLRSLRAQRLPLGSIQIVSETS